MRNLGLKLVCEGSTANEYARERERTFKVMAMLQGDGNEHILIMGSEQLSRL